MLLLIFGFSISHELKLEEVSDFLVKVGQTARQWLLKKLKKVSYVHHVC
jgi:hypothetical protein